MAITEKDTAGKWCPFARVWASDVEGGGESVSINRYGDNAKTLHPNAMCIGSVCMAWRWSRAKETEAYILAVQGHMKATGANFNVASNKMFAERADTFEQIEGYCGLAGKL